MALSELLLATALAAGTPTPQPTPTLMPFPIRSCGVANDYVSRSNAGCYRHLAYIVEKEGHPVLNRDPFYHVTEYSAVIDGKIVLYLFFNFNERINHLPSDDEVFKEFSFLKKGFECDFITVNYFVKGLQTAVVDVGLAGNTEVWFRDPETNASRISTSKQFTAPFKKQYDWEFVAPLLAHFKDKYPIPKEYSL